MAKLIDSAGGGGGDLNPGEVRTILAKDRETKETVKTITLHRTNRPYVFDLRDAYNDARTREALARGVEWYVNRAGDLKIGMAVVDPALRALHEEH